MSATRLVVSADRQSVTSTMTTSPGATITIVRWFSTAKCRHGHRQQEHGHRKKESSGGGAWRFFHGEEASWARLPLHSRGEPPEGDRPNPP
jgi:hypothetical protein